MKRSEVNPSGKVTYFDYNWRGQLVHTWGDVPYPEERTYNDFGDLVSLGTFQAGSGWTGQSWPTNTTGTTNVTLFKYDEPTGLLTNKVDAAGQVTTYNYYDNHELESVIWSRTNGVNAVGYTNIIAYNGDLVATGYTDGSLVIYTNFNRLGLPQRIVDDSGDHVLIYDSLGRQVSDSCTNGLLAGITVTNTFNYIGRSALSMLGTSSTLAWSYGYDSSRRLSTITNGSLTAAYSYLANSDLVQTLTGKSNSTTVLTTTRTWEGGND